MPSVCALASNVGCRVPCHLLACARTPHRHLAPTPRALPLTLLDLLHHRPETAQLSPVIMRTAAISQLPPSDNHGHQCKRAVSADTTHHSHRSVHARSIGPRHPFAFHKPTTPQPLVELLWPDSSVQSPSTVKDCRNPLSLPMTTAPCPLIRESPTQQQDTLKVTALQERHARFTVKHD
jgi:hypothetical protein